MNPKNAISVIIPVWNEAENLKKILPILLESNKTYFLEVIVVDGGSDDDSIDIAKQYKVRVISSPLKSRAIQLNLGAEQARGDILYFVHADSRPLVSFTEDILQEISLGNEAGCYRYEFDSTSKLLKMNSWFTRFNGFLSGGGDQTLFITKELFDKLGGYDQYFSIMEDFDLVRRIKRIKQFKIIPKSIKVSARKYDSNSWLRVQFANSLAVLAFQLNASPAKIKALYFKLLKTKV